MSQKIVYRFYCFVFRRVDMTQTISSQSVNIYSVKKEYLIFVAETAYMNPNPSASTLLYSCHLALTNNVNQELQTIVVIYEQKMNQ